MAVYSSHNPSRSTRELFGSFSQHFQKCVLITFFFSLKRYPERDLIRDAYRYDPTYKLQLATLKSLQRLGRAGAFRRPLEIAEVFWIYLDSRQPLPLQKEAIALFDVLIKEDSDAFWLILSDLQESERPGCLLSKWESLFPDSEGTDRALQPIVPQSLHTAEVLCKSLSNRRCQGWAISPDNLSELYSIVETMDDSVQNR